MQFIKLIFSSAKIEEDYRGFYFLVPGKHPQNQLPATLWWPSQNSKRSVI
jgi:hypothetical protein